MRLSSILSKIKQIQPENLPGFEAQAKMSPPMRRKFNKKDLESFNAKESAVMLLLYEKEEKTFLVFTQRHVYKGAHSGQISLPGGKRDAEDLDLKHTALRETWEEVGIQIPSNQVINKLTWLYVPPSNFVIHPFIAYVNDIPKFVKEKSEVKEILEIQVGDLLNKINQKNIFTRTKN